MHCVAKNRYSISIYLIFLLNKQSPVQTRILEGENADPTCKNSFLNILRDKGLYSWYMEKKIQQTESTNRQFKIPKNENKIPKNEHSTLVINK